MAGAEPIVPSPELYGYRNKMEFAFAERWGELVLGLRERGDSARRSRGRTVGLSECPIFSPVVAAVFPEVLRFAAEKEKTGVVFYESGKLVVQGKGTQEFVEFVLEPEILQEARLGYEAVLNPNLLLPRLLKRSRPPAFGRVLGRAPGTHPGGWVAGARRTQRVRRSIARDRGHPSEGGSPQMGLSQQPTQRPENTIVRLRVVLVGRNQRAAAGHLEITVGVGATHPIPGVAQPVGAVRSALVREPGDFIISPAVENRSKICTADKAH
jgi:hypothetical protein